MKAFARRLRRRAIVLVKKHPTEVRVAAVFAFSYFTASNFDMNEILLLAVIFGEGKAEKALDLIEP